METCDRCGFVIDTMEAVYKTATPDLRINKMVQTLTSLQGSMAENCGVFCLPAIELSGRVESGEFPEVTLPPTKVK